MASAIIANNFSMIADGNDLKFANRLRPTPDTYNFSFGDYVVFPGRTAMACSFAVIAWFGGMPCPTGFSPM